METFLKLILALHIGSGFLSLVAGLISFTAPKGKTWHRRSGKLFFLSMLGVTASALVISLARHNAFLLMIGIFSFYQNQSGYRAILNKSLRPAWHDWLVLAAGAVNTFFMIYSMNIVLMVFGGISCFLVIGNFKDNLAVLRGTALHPLSWLRRHIGMMSGAYIAAITAFVVVNSRLFASLPVPAWLPWLLPSAIIGPLIGVYMRRYTAKPTKVNDGER